MEPKCTCGTAGGRAHLSWCALVMPVASGKMVLQAQPSKWSCLPTSFAMVMGCEVKTIIDEIGHHDENGFHPQEVAWVALKRGWSFVNFDVEPTFAPTMCLAQGCVKGNVGVTACAWCKGTGYEVHLDVFEVPTIERLRQSYSGVLIGWAGDKEHAVAWDRETQKVFDPNFEIYDIERFRVESFMVARDGG